jgi:hypothetical protein
MVALAALTALCGVLHLLLGGFAPAEAASAALAAAVFLCALLALRAEKAAVGSGFHPAAPGRRLKRQYPAKLH